MAKKPTPEERLALKACCGCGEQVEEGETFAGIGKLKGHYHCVRDKLGPANFLEAVNMGLLSLLPDTAFIGRKLKKFAEEDKAKVQERTDRILGFVDKVGMGDAPGKAEDKKEDDEWPGKGVASGTERILTEIKKLRA